MPSEMDPMLPKEVSSSLWDKLLSENTHDLIPLDSKIKKTDDVEHKTFKPDESTQTPRQTRVQFITREAITAYNRTSQTNQLSASLFKEMVASVYRYLKEKLGGLMKSKPQISAPFNVEIASPEEKTHILEEHLKMAKKQLASLDHNLKHPKSNKLQLSPNYPRDLISLKELIHNLEAKINLKEVNEDSEINKEKSNIHQEYTELARSIAKLENTLIDVEARISKQPAQLQALKDLKMLTPKIMQAHQIDSKKLMNQKQAIEKELFEKKDRMHALESLVDNKTKVQTLVDAFEEEKISEQKIGKNLPDIPKPLDQFRARIETLRVVLRKEIAIQLNYSEKIDTLDKQITSLEEKLDALLVNDASSLDSIINLQKAINQLMDRKNELLVPQAHINSIKQELAEMVTTREREHSHFKTSIQNQEETLNSINQELHDLEQLIENENKIDIDLLHQNIAKVDNLNAEKTELEQHILRNKEILEEIIEELDILNTKSTTPKIERLRDLVHNELEIEYQQEAPLDTATPLKTRIEELKTQIKAHTESINTLLKTDREQTVNLALELKTDREKAIDLALEKDDLNEELSKLMEELHAESNTDFYTLAEAIRINKHDLSTIENKLAELRENLKNPTLSNVFGQNALKLKEYKEQRDALIAEINKNEAHLNELL